MLWLRNDGVDANAVQGVPLLTKRAMRRPQSRYRGGAALTAALTAALLHRLIMLLLLHGGLLLALESEPQAVRLMGQQLRIIHCHQRIHALPTAAVPSAAVPTPFAMPLPPCAMPLPHSVPLPLMR